MFDMPYNMMELLEMFASSDKKPPTQALGDRLDAYFSTSSNYFDGEFIFHEKPEMTYVGLGQHEFND